MSETDDGAAVQKTKKITVCVTGEYNEGTKEITGGDKVEIKVGDGEVHTSVEEALKELNPEGADEKKGSDAPPAAAAASEKKEEGDGATDGAKAEADKAAAAEIVQLKKEKDELETKNNTDGALSEADQKKFVEIQAKIVASEQDPAGILGGGRTRAKRRRPKRTGTKKKKRTKRQRKKGRKTKKH